MDMVDSFDIYKAYVCAKEDALEKLFNEYGDENIDLEEALDFIKRDVEAEGFDIIETDEELIEWIGKML